MHDRAALTSPNDNIAAPAIVADLMVGLPVRYPQNSGGVGCFVSSLNPRCAWRHLEVEPGDAPTLQSRYIFINCAKSRIALLTFCGEVCRLTLILNKTQDSGSYNSCYTQRFHRFIMM